ncbi:MAG TPA: hypothetical protein VHK69_00775 [Chitinophagaceae bacterium]|jgi:hypothetical protein|nr:hypothetical protein [Chitinophagaceae bacterium]
MILQFSRNVAFTRLVKVSGRLREFNFRKVAVQSDDPYFHVDVSDDRGNRIQFSMGRKDNTWTIREESIPQWVKETEPELQQVIAENDR